MLTGAIILSPSQQPENFCNVCGSEERHCRHLATEIKNYLKFYSNTFVDIVPQFLNEQTPMKLARVVEHSDQVYQSMRNSGVPHNKILHLCLHTDACDTKGRGVLAMHYPNNTSTQSLCSDITRSLVEMVGHGRTPQGNSELYEIRKAKAGVVYLETMFHDNIYESRLYHSKMIEIAGILSMHMLDYVN